MKSDLLSSRIRPFFRRCTFLFRQYLSRNRQQLTVDSQTKKTIPAMFKTIRLFKNLTMLGSWEVVCHNGEGESGLCDASDEAEALSTGVFLLLGNGFLIDRFICRIC